MGFGAFTRYVDIPQVVLYLFWIFFAGLLYYLRREDKREGYPLESERPSNIRIQGFPPIPPPKRFRLRSGETCEAPAQERERSQQDAAPHVSSSNPMIDGVGPGSYAERSDVPDLTAEGEIKIVPLRVAHDFSVATEDPDPRGMEVIAGDGVSPGSVSELWIDRSEPQIRYLEVVSADALHRVLLPINFARIDKRRRRITVGAILAHQFTQVPSTANPDQITLREEDRITAYFAGGYLYAEPSRSEPLI
jgi:photosynthetic reaction center H subunit